MSRPGRGGSLSIPLSEFKKINDSPEMRAALLAQAKQIAAQAGAEVGEPEGYGAEIPTQLKASTNPQGRAHVWPQGHKAIAAERKENSPLTRIVASRGRP